jgi:hypothetical protein
MTDYRDIVLLRHAIDAVALVSQAAIMLGASTEWYVHGFEFGEANPPITMREDELPPDGLDQVTFHEGFCEGSRIWAWRDLGARAE